MSKIRLPKEITLKWLEALRSGDYLQGQEYLKSENLKWEEETQDYILEDCHCCLGVLAEVVHKNNPIPYFDINGNSYVGLDDFDSEFINNFKKSGYPEELINYEDNSNKLFNIFSSMNDGLYSDDGLKHAIKQRFNITEEIIIRNPAPGQRVYTFVEIANFIEDNIELY